MPGSSDRGMRTGRRCCDTSLEENKGKTAYFGAVNNARFKRKVVPGDKLKMECEIIKKKGPVGVGKAVATVDGEVALTAELTFMVG